MVHEDFPNVWSSAITGIYKVIQEASLIFIDLLQLTENAESRLRGLSLLFQALKLIIKAPDRLEEEDDGHDILREKRFQLGTILNF